MPSPLDPPPVPSRRHALAALAHAAVESLRRLHAAAEFDAQEGSAHAAELAGICRASLRAFDVAGVS